MENKICYSLSLDSQEHFDVSDFYPKKQKSFIPKKNMI